MPPHWDLRQVELAKIDHPLHLWRKFVKDMVVQDTSIEEEILSSFYWQCKFAGAVHCQALMKDKQWRHSRTHQPVQCCRLQLLIGSKAWWPGIRPTQ